MSTAVEPPFRAGMVALAGRPNAGKSTLLNRLLGTKISIVTDRPQTTRTTISGVLNQPGAQLVLIDTPGVHRPLHRMNERMMQATRAALDGVDAIAAVTDVTEAIGQGDRFFLELLRKAGAPVLLVLNKIDRIRKPELLPLLDRWSKEFDFAELYPVSALTGSGIEALLAGFIARLPEAPALFPEDQLCDVSERFLAAEIIREKVILATREELPHSTTVAIESFEEPPEASGGPAEGERDRPRGLVRIEASILVERDSQKGIVIGKGGQLLKRIGTDARVEIEEMLGCRVFLGLVVKVRPRWRDDDRLLDRLGLNA